MRGCATVRVLACICRALRCVYGRGLILLFSRGDRVNDERMDGGVTRCTFIPLAVFKDCIQDRGDRRAAHVASWRRKYIHRSLHSRCTLHHLDVTFSSPVHNTAVESGLWSGSWKVDIGHVSLVWIRGIYGCITVCCSWYVHDFSFKNRCTVLYGEVFIKTLINY